jgi:hypothetical protein
MTVPQGFDAYARIFFPFIGADIEVDGEARQEHLTWEQIVQRNGRIVHAVMESGAIGQPPDPDVEPGYCGGEMGDEQLSALLPILTHHTSSPDGWTSSTIPTGLRPSGSDSGRPRLAAESVGMYSVETEVDALDEVAALPAEALPEYAELMTLLEVAPWSGDPLQPAVPGREHAHAHVR